MIKIQDLRKNFGSLRAVDGLSFEVGPGEVLGFLGPNGAGKSTTMKMLTGFLAPTSGSISVLGIDVVTSPLEAQRQTGYLPEGAPAWGDMTVLAFLKFIGEVRGFRGRELASRVDSVVQQVELQAVLQQRIETLSKGFRRRVGLAQAMIHDPQVLIMDEPTDGLDPNQKHQVRQLIKDFSKDKIVIVSTHILEEVHAVCTRAMIIAAGQLVADGTPDELAALSDYHRSVRVKLAENCEAKSRFEAIPEVSRVLVDASGLEFTILPVQGQRVFKPVNRLIYENNWPVTEFQVEKGRLDDVFRKVTVEAKQ
ncbi:MAG: multidrug ABC transporter ATP-binding protein [Gammaproteobacteria bacterium]|nr:MAG: multidrug ABC transporter ATP-binding protein [Pseudomonadota bacterium]PIE38545.1 MAG: multidrug ABC transporter ATP-binding protein [Gammaproteobacteria bacterium]